MFLKLLKIKLLLILLEDLQVQAQIKISVHDFNIDYINDIFYGKVRTQQTQEVSGVQCENEICTLNSNIRTKMLLQRGNVKVIELTSEKLKEPVRIELTIAESTTVINYEIKYLSPYFDIIYGMYQDKGKLLETKNLHHANKDVRYVYSDSRPRIENFRSYTETKELTEVSEKFKCGAFLSNLKLSQTVALAPKPNEGIIVLSPGSNLIFRLKICIREINRSGKSKCIDTTVNAGESIVLPELDGYEDEIEIKINDVKTPRVPLNMQDIIGEYTYSKETNKLTFSKLHVGNTPAIGNLNRDSISPLQTSSIITEDYLSEYKSFEPKELLSWNLVSQNSAEIPWQQTAKLKNVMQKITNKYTYGLLNEYFVQLISIQNQNLNIYNKKKVKFTQDSIMSEHMILTKGLDGEKKYFYDKYDEDAGRNTTNYKYMTDSEIILSTSSRLSYELNKEELELYNRSRFIFCKNAPKMLQDLDTCLNTTENKTVCIINFVQSIELIAKTNKFLAAYFGIFQINDELVQTIENNIQTYCVENYLYAVDRYMRTMSEDGDKVILRAFWIPIIIGLGILISIGVGVGVTDGIASTNKCSAQEVDIPISKQKSQIKSYPEFETMFPGILKELKTDLNVLNNKPQGTYLNLTNFEDQSVDIEIQAKGYKVDVKKLKSKIQNFEVTKCDFYLSKALSACEIIFNNVGDVSEVQIDVRGNSILSVTNRLIANIGVNKHSIQLSTPEIIDKNIEVCLIDDEKQCRSPLDIQVIDNPEIEGNDLIPKGGKVGSGGSAFDFWNLLKVNISFAVFIWIMWIIGFICLLILLMILCSICKWTGRKAKRICCNNGKDNTNYIYGRTDYLNNLTLLTLLCMLYQPIEGWKFSLHPLFNNPKAYSALIWSRPERFADERQPPYGSFEYHNFSGLMPPFYDFLQSTRMTLIHQVIDLVIETDLKYTFVNDPKPYDLYETDCLLKSELKYCLERNSTKYHDAYKRVVALEKLTGTHFGSELSGKKIINTISNILTTKIPDYITDVEVLTKSYFKLEWTNELDKFNQLEWDSKPEIYHNVGLDEVDKTCDITPRQFFYKNDGRSIYMSFVCIDSYTANRNPKFYRLRNYTYLGKIDSPENFAYNLLLLNKLYSNNIRHPVIMIAMSESIQKDVRYLQNYLKSLTSVDSWHISPGILSNNYAKIVMLWCDECTVTISEMKYQIKTGSLKPSDSFCLLPNGKISGAKVGLGTRVNCICDTEICYCFNLQVKLFAILKSQGHKLSSVFKNESIEVNVKETTIQCFVEEGGEIQLNKDGDFIAVRGPIQVTSDNWDNIDIIESGSVVKAPINQRVDTGIVEIRTLGSSEKTFLTIQKSDNAKISTFKSTWDKMNKDYPYVIPITIAVPSILILLIIISCFYRYCRGGKRIMKMMSYPITSTTDLIYRNFGRSKNDSYDSMQNKNGVVDVRGKVDPNYLNISDDSNGIKFRQRGRRPVM